MPIYIQIGDLVRHITKGWVGLVVSRDEEPTPFDDLSVEVGPSSDDFYRIDWIGHESTHCVWQHEIEVINEQ
jgi:hypothetical protein